MGTVYPVVDARTGYKCYRWRISWDGTTYGPYSVGVRRGSTERKQEENDRAAKAKAETALRKFRARLEAGERPSREAERRTVGEQVAFFLKEAERRGRSASTKRTYASMYEHHVKDWPIAQVRLSKFTDDTLRDHEHALKDAERSDSTIRYVDTLLRAALRLRVGGKRLVDADVLDAVDKPAVGERREGKPFTEAQVGLFFQHAEGDWREFYLTMYLGALRWGEDAALGWEDVDEVAGGITIRRHADNITRRILPSTKGGKDRWVPMPAGWCQLIAERRRRMGSPTGLVFPAADAGPLPYRDCVREFKAILSRAKLPDDRRQHDLRHSWNSHARRAKIDPRTRADMLGHASPSELTDGTYSQVDDELGRAATEAVAARAGLFGVQVQAAASA